MMRWLKTAAKAAVPAGILVVSSCSGDLRPHQLESASPTPTADSESTQQTQAKPAPIALADSVRFAGFHNPSPGNRLVTSRDDLLYVVWSIPKSMGPFSELLDSAQWEPFILNTALHMCSQEIARKTGNETTCLVHILQLASNDEYSTAAAAGWRTVGKLRVPIPTLEGTSSKELRSGTVGQLRARFSKIGLDLAQLTTDDAG